MERVRAEIVDTGIPLFYKVKLEIKASAKVVFDLIADPKNHALIDGSGAVRGQLRAPSRLSLGASFGMKMRIGIPYIINNHVIEFEENRAIAWHHLLGNIWRYELMQIDPNTTLVVESWDGRKVRFTWWPTMKSSERWAPKAMAKTLVRLKELAEKQVS